MTDRSLQLTLRGPVAAPDGAPIDRLAAEFAARRCVTIPRLMDPALLAWVQGEIGRASLVENRHGDDLASELALPPGTCLGLLTFLVNDPILLRFIERVTGLPRLTRFIGRVYSRIPGTHHDSWHDDIHPDRLVGMSINLSTGVYQGGVFEIRETESRRPLGALANVGFGDAILFAIRDDLQHRVSPLSGAVRKTAYAGWFGATRNYDEELREDPALTGSA